MTLEDIKCGESKNIEFKVQLPDDSKKYMKTIVAYANTSGGKMIIGVDDATRSIVGVEPSSVFQIMDKIVNAVSDMCVPQIIPDVTFQTIEGKCIVQIEIYPGQNRPYYEAISSIRTVCKCPKNFQGRGERWRRGPVGKLRSRY